MPESCERELRDLIAIMGSRTDLTTMHERYLHECHVHNDSGACENAKTVLQSLGDPEALKALNNATADFVKCIKEVRE